MILIYSRFKIRPPLSGSLSRQWMNECIAASKEQRTECMKLKFQRFSPSSKALVCTFIVLRKSCSGRIWLNFWSLFLFPSSELELSDRDPQNFSSTFYAVLACQNWMGLIHFNESFHCPLYKQCAVCNMWFVSKKETAEMWFKPGQLGLKARMLRLCYAAP